MNEADLQKRLKESAALGRKIAEVMRSLPKQGAVIKPDFVYRDALTQLERESSSIAFCGKVNCGKSTLLNSIIGRKVLPTGNKPVTSRIVEIENCSSRQKEQVSLILHDGTQKTYSGLEKLNQFAVEQGYAEDGEPVRKMEGVELEQIALIRVCCHMPHMPDGIRFVDTPGIGASYKEHGALSYMYLERAHAVVYVMKSDAPLTQEDIPFIQNVLKANKNVIFVQSCADLFPNQDVEQRRESNLALLTSLHCKVGTGMGYYTLAAQSKLTPPTAEGHRERCECYAGQYGDFMIGLRWLLYKTAGSDLLMRALVCCGVYMRENITAFRDRLKIVLGEETEARICIQTATRARLFREDWIGGGRSNAQKWNQFVKQIENDVREAKADMVRLMTSVEQEELARLDEISTEKDSAAFKKELPEKIQAVWLRVQELCVSRINETMNGLTDISPTLLTNTNAAGRVVRGGVLVPLNIRDAGFTDVLRYGWDVLRLGVGVARVAGSDIVGGSMCIVSSVKRLFFKEDKNALAIKACKEALSSKMSSIRKNLSKCMDSASNPLAIYFQRAVSHARTAVTARYQTLVSEAAAHYMASCKGEEERRNMINILQGSDNKKGLIEAWERGVNWIDACIQEVEQRD